MTFDETFDIGGRPYSVRTLSLREARELAELGPEPGMKPPVDIVDAVMRQVTFLLVGPDGEAPDPERILDDVTLTQALQLAKEVWDA